MQLGSTGMIMTLCLFGAGIAMGIGGALMWAWGVRSGQFRDLEKTKGQLFWPEIAPDPDPHPGDTVGSSVSVSNDLNG